MVHVRFRLGLHFIYFIYLARFKLHDTYNSKRLELKTRFSNNKKENSPETLYGNLKSICPKRENFLSSYSIPRSILIFNPLLPDLALSSISVATLLLHSLSHRRSRAQFQALENTSHRNIRGLIFPAFQRNNIRARRRCSVNTGLNCLNRKRFDVINERSAKSIRR